MRKCQDKVAEFHKNMGLSSLSIPTPLTGFHALKRIALIQEELTEYTQACASGDVIKQADALADLIYVVVGSAVESGIDLDQVFDEVHKSNMTKVGGKINECGKLVKPATYSPPDIKKVLLSQGYKD